jgi:hypothetical protein
MKYLVFNTESEALQAEAAISVSMGYAKAGINAATGEIEPNILTVKWADVQQIQDGRWVFVSPDDQGEEAQSDWFRTDFNYLG